MSRNVNSVRNVLAFGSRFRHQGFGNVKITRSSLDCRSNRKFLKQRLRPIKIKCPKHLSNIKFLNKGCNGIVCSIPTDQNIVVKQAYKFEPHHTGTLQVSHENKIFDKLQSHPNILQKVNDKPIILDICGDSKFVSSCPDVEHIGVTPSLILERMEMSLDNLLKSADLSTIDKIDILSQILEAQVYMSQKLICHRDMKLSNILVNVSTNHSYAKYPCKYIVKVADFDNALDMSVKSSEFSAGGSRLSTAPEILKYSRDNILNQDGKRKDKMVIVHDNKKLYFKNDIWAIGGMAYEIFGYENPFNKIDAEKYNLFDLPPMEHVPSVICGLIKCLLQPNPQFRYHSCVAADILCMYRLKETLTEKVFHLLKCLPVHTIVAFCYLNQLYYSGTRFMSDPSRLRFVLNYINE